MRNRKLLAALGMTAALAGGSAVGVTLGNPLTSGAQDTTTTTAASSGSDTGSTGTAKGPEGRGARGGLDLEVAAKTLKLSTEELRTELQAGKSLAAIAEAQGVDKQTLIDALVKAAETRLDAAKEALPETIAEMVDSTRSADGHGGPGGHGPGGQGSDGHRGPGLDAAAKALGVTVDDLSTALKDGKTIAEVAEDKGVDKQKVIDAMVAEAKTRTAAAVKEGKLTQAEADERLAEQTTRITTMVNEGKPAGGPEGRGPAEQPEGN